MKTTAITLLTILASVPALPAHALDWRPHPIMELERAGQALRIPGSRTEDDLYVIEPPASTYAQRWAREQGAGSRVIMITPNIAIDCGTIGQRVLRNLEGTGSVCGR